MSRSIQRIGLAVLLAIVAAPATAQQQDPASTPPKAKRTTQWIGVMCYPVRGALRSQLDLPRGKGLVVAEVVADSPGAKAGIHKDMPGGKTYLGAPAAPIDETTRQVMALKKLPDLRRTVRKLERDVAALTSQLNSLTETQSDPADDAARPAA